VSERGPQASDRQHPEFSPENQFAAVNDVTDGTSGQREKEEGKCGSCLKECNLSVLLLSEVMSQAAPTACMKAPTSEAKSAMSRFRNRGIRSGRHGLAASGWMFLPSPIIRDFIPSWSLKPYSPFARRFRFALIVWRDTDEFGGMPPQLVLVVAICRAGHKPPALALNGIEFNLARAVGPAPGGLIIASFSASCST